MNILPKNKQIQVISALVEGCSIRSIERMYDVHRDTIMRLMVRTGDHCMSLMDDLMQDIPAGTYQVDEIWTFVGKKDKRLAPVEKSNPEIGSQFIFVATKQPSPRSDGKGGRGRLSLPCEGPGQKVDKAPGI